MTLQPFAAPPPVLALQAATPVGGFALQNATPNIITWTAPNDGNNHRVTVQASILVGTTETGGIVGLQFTGPGASGITTAQVFAAGLAAATNSQTGATFQVIVAPGTLVALKQTSALTLGAATVYAELWGS